MTITLAHISNLHTGVVVFYWFRIDGKISGNHSTISWQLFSLLANRPGGRGAAVGRSLLNYYRHANERRLNMCRKTLLHTSINVIIENKGTFVDRDARSIGRTRRRTPIMPSRAQLACLSEQNIGWHPRGHFSNPYWAL